MDSCFLNEFTLLCPLREGIGGITWLCIFLSKGNVLPLGPGIRNTAVSWHTAVLQRMTVHN